MNNKKYIKKKHRKINYLQTICFVMLILTSCGNNDCKPYKIQNYSVEITLSSFWDCGDFEKIIINNDVNSELINKVKRYSLYRITTKNNCSISQIDTLSQKITMIQSDSIYELANVFIENYKMNNLVTKCFREVRTIDDGGDLTVEVRLENISKSVKYHHYGNLNEISNDLTKLMMYINHFKLKKQKDQSK